MAYIHQLPHEKEVFGAYAHSKDTDQPAKLHNMIRALSITLICILTLVMLNPDIPCLANSVNPDQLASSSGSALFAIM